MHPVHHVVPRAYLLALVGGLCLATACASAGTGTRERRSEGVLTRAEILATQENTLLAVVRRQRPQWLRARGAARSAIGLVSVAVYVDDVRFGGTEALEDVPVDVVSRVEFIDATDAATRYGLDVAGGVIAVYTIRRGPTPD